MSMRTALLLIVPLLASCGDVQGQAANELTQPTVAAASASPDAAALCAEAAVGWGGVVAAAFPARVKDVRAHMNDPHGADQDPAAPRPGAYDYPEGWDALPPEHQAAACYLDGQVPKGPPPALNGSEQPASDRRFVMAAAGVPSFMVSAGPQANMPLTPLRR